MGQFVPLSRQKFRRYFQPSRIALAVFQPTNSRANVITLAFDMYCSYKPSMFAFAVHQSSFTSVLQAQCHDCVISVPGESLANFAMYCGTTSGADTDKIGDCGEPLVESNYVGSPGLQRAIANIEAEIVTRVATGDHTTIVCKTRAFNVNVGLCESCLLSVGPEHSGYRVLTKKGIHRIGVVGNASP